jgi:hypothetical protein
MKTYIGVKIVQAEPETKNGEDGYKVVYPAEFGKPEYVSWCPKNVFEKHNCETTAMTFGHALEALKQGKKAARKNWNGKGMWIGYHGGTDHDIPGLPYLYIEYPIGHPAYPKGCWVPWLASQTDMLSDDWYIVE